MTTKMIPCKHPWAAITYDKSSEAVNVRITKGSQAQDYELHVTILRHYSGYFRSKFAYPTHLPDFDNLIMIHRLTETNAASRRPDIILEVDNPAVFDAYAIWLYHGTFSRAGAIPNMSRLFLCQMYVFGLRSDTPLLQNAVIDALVARLASDDAVPYDIIAYLETHALGSRLNKLVLNIVKHCGEKEDVKGWSHSFSPESIGTVKESMGERLRVKGYLEGAMVCGKYHIHLEADERDGEGFWFDPPVKKAGGV
jgi:hypothetical protein